MNINYLFIFQRGLITVFLKSINLSLFLSLVRYSCECVCVLLAFSAIPEWYSFYPCFIWEEIPLFKYSFVWEYNTSNIFTGFCYHKCNHKNHPKNLFNDESSFPNISRCICNHSVSIMKGDQRKLGLNFKYAVFFIKFILKKCRKY